MGDDGVGLGPLPIEQGIHASLEQFSQGLEKHGDQSGGEERNQQVAPRAKERAQIADHQHVGANDAGSQRTINERAIDDEVDVPEAVAKKGDAEGKSEQESA